MWISTFERERGMMHFFSFEILFKERSAHFFFPQNSQEKMQRTNRQDNRTTDNMKNQNTSLNYRKFPYLTNTPH